MSPSDVSNVNTPSVNVVPARVGKVATAATAKTVMTDIRVLGIMQLLLESWRYLTIFIPTCQQENQLHHVNAQVLFWFACTMVFQSNSTGAPGFGGRG